MSLLRAFPRFTFITTVLLVVTSISPISSLLEWWAFGSFGGILCCARAYS